jgi:Gpi18-like mannosyltransferase
LSILLIYFNQAGEFEELAKTAPNLYIFFNPNDYHPAFEIGLLIFAVSMVIWVWLNWKAEPVQEQSTLILAALTSLSLVPFLLPKMHDRYFYPADVFSYAAALLNPRLWFIPFLFQISSGLAYTIFLFNAQPVFVYLAAIINTVLVSYITYTQIRSLKKSIQE